jgi:SAM-dependent methyltransferase
MMNADQLRETYNRYFSTETNKWSSTSQRETQKIARTIFSWLKRYGFTKTKPTLLDVGCGTGYFTQAFSSQGIGAVGLDYSEVALEKARTLFMSVSFIQMNGFEPQLNNQFDIIFCRGFSGFNTHDLNFVSGWVNRYIPSLNPGGYFILGYSTDFSGTEKQGETVNHSKEELSRLCELVQADFVGMKMFSYLGWISVIKRWLYSTLLGKQQKVYFYLFFRRSGI